MGELDCSTSRKWGHVSRQPSSLSWVISRWEMHWMRPHLRRHRQIYNFLQPWLVPDHGKKLSKWKIINPDVVKQNCHPQVIWNQVTGKTEQVTSQKNAWMWKGVRILGVPIPDLCPLDTLILWEFFVCWGRCEWPLWETAAGKGGEKHLGMGRGDVGGPSGQLITSPVSWS